MAFLVKVPWVIVSVISQLLNCYGANQMGFKQVFDNLTVKHMDDSRKQIQSVVDYVSFSSYPDHPTPGHPGGQQNFCA